MTEEAKPTDLLDAITAGIEDADPKPEAEAAPEETDSSEDDNQEGESEESVEQEGEAQEGEAAEGEASTEEGKEGEAKTEAAKEGETSKDVTKEQPKQPDPVNDPLPKNLKNQTRERITKLIGITKSVTAERDVALQQRDEIMGFIQDSKATPQQYSEALGVLKMINSGTPEGLEKAIGFFQNQINILARAAGKPVPGVDMLANHADLQREVKEGLLSRQRAEELAAVRERQAVQTHQAQRQTQQTQLQQQADMERNAGREALNQLDASLRADPQYAQKRAVLVESLKPVFSQIHPLQWAATFKAAWDRLQVAAPAPKPTIKLPTNQPLRVKSPAGGGATEPKSLEDAISFGISQAR